MDSSENLFLAILSMDAYDRGYGSAIAGLSDAFGTQIGDATILASDGAAPAQVVGFYAVAYDWNGDPRGIQGALEWLKAGPFKDKEGKILTRDAAGGLRLDRLGALTVDRKKEKETE